MEYTAFATMMKPLMALLFGLLFLGGTKTIRGQLDVEDEDKRYIFYDVNPGEGFNLRRDVFVRMAVMIRKLNENPQRKFHFILVLPPWGPLYHWQTRSLGEQSRIPWKQFFDLESIARFIPVMDFEDYLSMQNGNVVIDMVYYLQNYKEGWKSGEFREKMDVQDCLNPVPYQEEDDLLIDGPFWAYFGQVRAKDIRCLSVQGTTQIMRGFIEGQAENFKTIMLDRGEQLLHELYGSHEYWSARRSMRFAKHLVKIADDFRAKELASNDDKEGTVIPENWLDHQPPKGSARGGPYVCAHVRRKDYVYSRKGQIPDLANAAEQLLKKCKDHNVDTVYIATDAPKGEVDQLRKLLTEVKMVKFDPSLQILNQYKDGGVAILDQIICSHAKYFIGSTESTFTFRIQEEREIMGFNSELTFDMLCKNGEFNCSKGSVWRIAYPKNSIHSEL